MIDTTVAVVGGGPLGLAAARALGVIGLDCVVVDAREPEAAAADPRVLALSHGSRQILEWIGAWKGLDANPIRAIHISQRGRFGRTRLSADELGLPALGHVCRAGDIVAALRDAPGGGVSLMHGSRVEGTRCEGDAVVLALDDGRSLRARLAVFAEGGIAEQEGAILRDYGQHALVATASVDRPHGGLAWERFTPEGPVALLPMGEDYSVVWVVGDDEARRIRALEDDALRDELQVRFGGRLRFESVCIHASFPLALRLRRTPAGNRRVWLGNSAQTLHPVAGQGFNLALRDAWELAEFVRREPQDPGAASLLLRHARSRRMDRLATTAFTDALIRIFCARGAGIAAGRGGALLALDLLDPMRGFLARRMIFGARAWP